MRKWKIAGLLVSQAALTYAVFVICIHEPKSINQQVDEAVGWQQSQLRAETSRLNSIIFRYVQQPTTVTIEETRKMRKPDRSSILQSLKPEDITFLNDIANGK